jgi:protein phosphatase
VRAALVDADRAIERSIATRTDASGAATVALCQAKGATLSRWLVAWVGDCRVYHLRAAGEAAAELLTVDDSYRHLREEPPAGGSLDDPARMVGNGAVDVPNIARARLRPGDMLVLCSDGVHRHAEAADIARLLTGSEPLARRCVRLIDFVRDNGSSDDATVLVVQRVEHDFLRSARLVIIAAIVALLAGASAWLAQDPAAVRDVAPATVDSPPSRGST